MMELPSEFFREIIEDWQRRCEAIKSVGGISQKDVLEGAKIPDGWILDYETDYYVPPDFQFFGTVH